ncbi:MAG TPA: PLP-dependent aminotransferase family protein [Polyangiaceae bacterium]
MDPRIDRLQRASANAPSSIGLAGGLPAPELFPRAGFAQAFLDAVRVPACPALQYGWPEGDEGLRAWVAARLRNRGVPVAAEDVLITNGAQEAISIAAELLVPRGAGVAVDGYTYPAALELFRARGATPRRALDGCACAYVMPGVANPGGSALPLERRAALLACGIPLIADEAYTELRFDGRIERPLLADARDRVWHVGTLSKTLCPGLRVGWLVPPRTGLPDAIDAKHRRDLQAGSLSQEVARIFLLRDDFDARLSLARAFYRRRAERLLRALRRRFGSWTIHEPVGGFSVLVETDLAGDDAQLLATATAHGVSFDPGQMFRAAPASGSIALRVCFSTVPTAFLDDGAERLSRAVRAFTRRPTLC